MSHVIRGRGGGRGGDGYILEQHSLLGFINHARVSQLLNVVHLLSQHSHGSSVALNGLEPLRGLNLTFHNEAPNQSALLHELPD